MVIARPVPRARPATSTAVARGGTEPTPTEFVAVALCCLSAIAGMGVLFSDNGWWGPSLVAIAAVTITGYVLRRTVLPAGVLPLVQLAVFLGTQVFYFRAAVPAPAIGDPFAAEAAGPVDGYRDLLLDGLQQARESAAPTASSPGLAAALAVLVFLMALLAETLAIGLGHAGFVGLIVLAIVAIPPGILPGVSMWWAALAGAGWLVLLAACTRGTQQPRGGPRWWLSSALAAALTMSAAGLGWGALSDPTGSAWLRGLGSSFGGPGADGSVSIDPLVSVREQLTRGSAVEVLRYRTPDGSGRYLSLVTLRAFDGQTWTPGPARLGSDVAEPLPDMLGGADVSEVSVEVLALENPALPVPEFVTTIDIDGSRDAGSAPPWVWNAITGDAVGLDARATGTTYRARAAPPLLDPDRLRSSGSSAPDDPVSLAVPASVPDAVAATARRVTAGAASPYGKAVALQRWFTDDGGFTYSLAVPDPGQRDPTIAFLADRVGFCQQFASTMALMARTLGIPARVVVGFAPGAEDANGNRVVRGGDAHAWPELWFDDVGWVRFEPTPAATGTTYAGPPYAPSPQGPQPGADGATPAPSPAPSAVDPDGSGTAEGAGGAGGLAGSGGAAMWLLGLLLLPLAVPALIRHDRRRRRLDRAAAGDAVAAMAEVDDIAIDVGSPRSAGQTVRAFAEDELAPRCRGTAVDGPLTRLVQAYERQCYADAGAPADAVGLDDDVRLVLAALRPMGIRGRLRVFWAPGSVIGRARPSSPLCPPVGAQ